MELLTAGIGIGWLGYNFYRDLNYNKKLQKISKRILVGGIRGKSSLVKLIHTGLVESNIPSISRISGNGSLILGPGNNENKIARMGNANIREIRQAILYAESQKTQVAVIENMAIKFDLQKVVARNLVKPHLTILLGGGLDHGESWPVSTKKLLGMFEKSQYSETKILLSSNPDSTFLHDGFDSFDLIKPSSEINTILKPYMNHLVDLAVSGLNEIDVEVTPNVKEAILKKAEALQKVNIYSHQSNYYCDLMSLNDHLSTMTCLEYLNKKAIQSNINSVKVIFNHRKDRPIRLGLFKPIMEKYSGWIIGDKVDSKLAKITAWEILEGNTESQLKKVFSQSNPKEKDLICLIGNAEKSGKEISSWLNKQEVKWQW